MEADIFQKWWKKEGKKRFLEHGNTEVAAFSAFKCGHKFANDITKLTTSEPEDPLADLRPGQAIEVPEGLVWTKEKPTKPGWYWFKRKGLSKYPMNLVVCLLDYKLNGNTLLVFDYSNETTQPLPDTGEWAGPIPEPGEEKEEAKPKIKWRRYGLMSDTSEAYKEWCSAVREWADACKKVADKLL